MTLIKVKGNILIDDIDQLYLDLYQGFYNKQVIDVLLPNKLTKNYLGITPALIQFIATWIRYENSGKLLLSLIEPTKSDIDELYKNEFIFPIVSMAWNSNGVYDKTGTVNLSSQLKDFQNQIFLKMKEVKAYRGEKLLLTNLDHFNEEKGILSCFEREGEFIANENDLLESLKPTILGDVLRNYYESKETFKKVQNDFNGIIYELMKNTYEWAKENPEGVPFDPNIRGLLIKFYKKPRKKLIEEYEYNRAITTYFNSNILKENVKGELYFFEISVFDSGAGFVDKYKALNPDTTIEDVEIIKQCFIKHNTSAKGLDKFEKGFGLDKILKTLDKKGFLRIKTGNVCLYRDLISNNYKTIESKDINEMELFDWRTGSDNSFTKHKKVSGSIITIIYPLAFN
jgi:hypothetical protein